MLRGTHSNSAETAQASRACNFEMGPVHLSTTEFGQVDKTSVEATQLVPLSEPSNGHKVRQKNSQIMIIEY